MRTISGCSRAQRGDTAAYEEIDSDTLVTTGATGLVWIDTATLRMARPATHVKDTGAIAELAMSDGALASAFDPAVSSPIGLMRVEAP